MKSFFAWLLLGLSVLGSAQSYQFTVYNTANSGIPSNYVNDIKKSPSGTLWIGTNSGLSAMVGDSFTTYNTSNSTLPANAIKKIAFGTNNKMWLMTAAQGVILRNGTTHTLYNMNNSGIPANACNGIATDGLGNLWVASGNGLGKFDGTSWTVYTTDNGLPANSVTSVFVTPANEVYLTCAGAIMKRSGNTFVYINDGAEKILNIIGSDLYFDTFDGFARMSLTNPDSTDYYWTNNSCLWSCGVDVVGVDDTSKIWLGLKGCGSGGLQRFTDCTTYLTTNSDLPDNGLTAIHIEDSNVIWAATEFGGLVRLNKTDGPVGCLPPTGLYADEISSFGAAFHWTAPDPAPEGYLYACNTVNTVGGLDGYTTDPVTWLDQLEPSTTYYWWVASACEPQVWVPGGSFTTLAAPVSTACFAMVAAANQSSMAIKADGHLFGWGENVLGSIGDNIANANVPKPAYIPGGWKSISMGGHHSAAVRTDGTLWTMGNNQYGNLGIGATNALNLPVQVGTANDWKSATAGTANTYAIKTNGTLWACGDNSAGQLGVGSNTASNVMIQVGTGSNWKQIAAGATFVVAVKTDGTLWGWGWNSEGQVGDGTTLHRNTPVQIGTATDWDSVAAGWYHAVARKTNGTLWSWGSNDYGNLGDGTTTDKHAPVQIGSGANWAFVAAGQNHSIGIKADGTLWTWGRNNYGQLGHGDTINKNVPTQAGAQNSWMTAAGGNAHTLALTTDGALRTWGRNDYGQLGNASTDPYYVPGTVSCPESLGTPGFDTVSLKLYPNPTQGQVALETDAAIRDIVLHDLRGVRIDVPHQGLILDVSSLASGIYLLTATTDSGQSVTRRLVRE